MQNYSFFCVFSGFDDIVSAIKMYVTNSGTFKWAQWFAKKVVAYAAACLGYASRVWGDKFACWKSVNDFLGVRALPTEVLSKTAAIDLVVDQTIETLKSEGIGKRVLY